MIQPALKHQYNALELSQVNSAAMVQFNFNQLCSIESNYLRIWELITEYNWFEEHNLALTFVSN